jgi:hypothetical protein
MTVAALRRPWIDAAALSVVFIALTATSWGAWPDVLVDFGRELYVAWRVSAGDVLYRDVASFYGPLSPYVNAAVFRVLGVSLRALVMANLVLLAATTWMLRALLLRAGTARWVATGAAAAFLALFGFGHLISMGSFNFVCPYAHEATHGFALGVAALLCALRGPRAPAWTGAAGALCGLAFLTKPESFVAALGACGLVVVVMLCGPGTARPAALGGLPATSSPSPPRPSKGGPCAAFLAGLAVPPLVAWALLAAAMPAEDAGLGVLGSWAYVGSPELRGMNYFGWSAGVDRPLDHLRALARASGLQAAVLGPALAVAWWLRGRARAAPWAALGLAAVLALFLAWRWSSREWLPMARPLPLWTLALLAASAAVLWRERGADPDARARALARTALCAFALLLLPRIFFNARFFHYGFVLSSVATLIVIAALLDWIPRALDRRGAPGAVFRAVAALAVGFVVASAVRDSHRFMAAKQVDIGSGADAFRADVRGRFVASTLESLTAVAPQGTLVALPEGVMINYLLRRPSSIPYLTMLPSDEAQFGEDELLGSLERRPPDLVVFVHRTTHEFGLPLFGRDYAQRTVEWIYARYGALFTVGDPPLQPDTRFGIRVLRRAPDGGRR